MATRDPCSRQLVNALSPQIGYLADMRRKALKVVTELHFRTVSCPGVHLGAKDDLYLSVCVMGQHRTSLCVPAVFPLILQEKMTIEKIFRYAVDPGDIAVMMEYETVKIDLVQLTPPDGYALAWFEEDARHFLFPEPKLVPSYSGVGREVLMTRAPDFPGIAPRLEFWTRTTICECSAMEESHVYPNVSTGPRPSRKPASRARKLRAASPRRRPGTTGPGGGGGGATGLDGGPHVVFQLGNHPTGGSRPGGRGRSSPPVRRKALPDRSPAPSKSSPTRPRPLFADGRRASDAGSSSSSESDAPIGRQQEATPSALWQRYRQQQSSYSRSRCGGPPPDSWEEVQQRVRGLLTTPKAVRRLLFGSTVSEVEEVLTRRSISPGLLP